MDSAAKIRERLRKAAGTAVAPDHGHSPAPAHTEAAHPGEPLSSLQRHYKDHRLSIALSTGSFSNETKALAKQQADAITSATSERDILLMHKQMLHALQADPQFAPRAQSRDFRFDAKLRRVDAALARLSEEGTTEEQRAHGLDAIAAGTNTEEDQVKKKLLEYLVEKHQRRLMRKLTPQEIDTMVKDIQDKTGFGLKQLLLKFKDSPVNTTGSALRGAGWAGLATAGGWLGLRIGRVISNRISNGSALPLPIPGSRTIGTILGAPFGPFGLLVGNVLGAATGTTAMHVLTRRRREIADAARIFNTLWSDEKSKREVLAAVRGGQGLDELYNRHKRSKLWGAAKFSIPIVFGGVIGAGLHESLPREDYYSLTSYWDKFKAKLSYGPFTIGEGASFWKNGIDAAGEKISDLDMLELWRGIRTKIGF